MDIESRNKVESLIDNDATKIYIIISHEPINNINFSDKYKITKWEPKLFTNTKSINFIKILTKFSSVPGYFIILIFTLNINDTVSFKEGQIFSDTPQLKINAPNEVLSYQSIGKRRSRSTKRRYLICF